MDQSERLSRLREYEQECYSICYYLLQSETMACEASKHALYRLFQCDSFFVKDPGIVKDLLRKESIQCALQIKKLV